MNTLRIAKIGELSELSDLCLRSKAHWGYDAGFIEACREALTITPEDLKQDHVWVADGPDGITGVLQVQTGVAVVVLDKLFIDPTAMGLGVGRLLFEKATELAKATTATVMTIDADPGAESFYVKMGAKTVDKVPSTVIEGRTLPFMQYDLSP